MISTKTYQKSPVRGPVFENVLPHLAVLSSKQLKGDVSVWFPVLVVAGNTRRFVQLSKSMRQSSDERTASLGVMKNAHGGWLGKGTIDHGVSFDYVRCQAK